MKRLLIIAALAFSFTASGQNIQSKEEINRIKRDADSFIFAETTMDKEDEAKSLARDFLMEYISQWMKQNSSDSTLSEASVDSMTIYIVTSRGPMFRVLAYIPKNSLPGFDPEQQAPSVEEVDSGPAHDTEAEPEPEPEPEPAPGPEPIKVYDFAVDRVMAAADKDELMAILYSEEMRECCRFGDINSKTNPSSLSECLLVIYSKENGEIKAVLSQKNPERINMRSKVTDSTSNYPKCGAIWISPLN